MEVNIPVYHKKNINRFEKKGFAKCNHEIVDNICMRYRTCILSQNVCMEMKQAK